MLASVPVRLSATAPIHLKIEARGAEYDFYYSQQPDKWILLKAGADGIMLSTKVAGGFIGTYFGMYAYTPSP